MGSQFSAGPFPPVFEEIGYKFTVLDLAARRLKFIRQHKGDSNIIRIQDVKSILELSDEDAYRAFQYLDHNSDYYINHIEFWSAVCLCSKSSPDEKIAFCFEVADYNEDKYISPNELLVLLRCATRSISNIKGVKYPEMNQLVSIVRLAAMYKNTKLNEMGEISMIDLRSFMLSYDGSRIYLTNLGSQVESEDKLKLLSNRHDIIKNIRSLEEEIEILERNLDWKDSDERFFTAERGGDADLLFLEKVIRQSGIDEESSSISLSTSQTTIDRPDVVNPVLIRPNNNIQDGTAFQRNGKGPTHGRVSAIGVFANLEHYWSRSQELVDRLAICDEEMIARIFGAVGIELTSSDIVSCLEFLAPYRNQTNKVPFDKLWLWFESIYSPQSRTSNTAIGRYTTWYKNSIQNIRKFLMDRFDELNREYYISSILRKDNEVNGSSGAKTINSALLQGSTALSAWQRLRLSFPSNRLTIRAQIGPDVPPEILRSKNKMRMTIDGEYRSKLEIKSIDFFNFQNLAFEELSTITSPHLIRKAMTMITALEAKTKAKIKAQSSSSSSSSSSSEYPGSRKGNENSNSNNNNDDDDNPFLKSRKKVEEEKSYGTIIWFGVTLQYFITENQARCLVELFVRGVELVLCWLDFSKGCKVVGDICYLSGYSQTDSSNARQMGIIIMILFEEDFVEIVEDQLPPGVYITRILRRFHADISLEQSWNDIVACFQDAVGLKGRLFGPQENELEEDMANPIKFIRAHRQKRDDIESVIKNSSITVKDYQLFCKKYGFYDQGDPSQLKARVRRIVEQQLMLLNYGEISEFGREIVEKMMAKILRQSFPVRKSFSLWPMNEFLMQLGSPCTIFDQEEYKALMIEEELLCDEDEHLTLAGLCSYYERYGRLFDDCQQLRILSLDELLVGKCNVNIEYDPEALNSLFTIIDAKSFTWKSQVWSILRAVFLRHGEFDVHYEHMDGFLRGMFNLSLSWLTDSQSFVHKFEGIMSYWADGEHGFIPSLRHYLSDVFGKYHNWEDILDDFLQSTVPTEERDEMDEEYDDQEVEDENDEEIASKKEELSNNDAKSIHSKMSDKSNLSKDKEGLKPSSSTSNNNGNNSNTKEEEEDEDEDEDDEDQYYSLKSTLSRFKRLLPPFPKLFSYQQTMETLGKDKQFLRSYLEDDNNHLTRLDLENCKAILHVLERKMKAVEDDRDNLEKSMLCYFCACYDACRLYCEDIFWMGVGNEELSWQSSASGFNFTTLLPPGLGEMVYSKETMHQKQARADKRKQAALLAIQREKARRADAMKDAASEADSAEEKRKKKNETMSQELQVAQLLSEILDISNEQLFPNYSTEQLKKLHVKWKELSSVLNNMSAKSFKALMAFNNAAVTGLQCLELAEHRAANVELLTITSHGIVDLVKPKIDLEESRLGASQMLIAFSILSNYLNVMKEYSMHPLEDMSQLHEKLYFLIENQPLSSFEAFGLPFYFLDNKIDWDSALFLSTNNIAEIETIQNNSAVPSTKNTTRNKFDAIRKRRELYDMIQSNEITKIFDSVSKGNTKVMEQFGSFKS